MFHQRKQHVNLSSIKGILLSSNEIEFTGLNEHIEKLQSIFNNAKETIKMEALESADNAEPVSHLELDMNKTDCKLRVTGEWKRLIWIISGNGITISHPTRESTINVVTPSSPETSLGNSNNSSPRNTS